MPRATPLYPGCSNLSALAISILPLTLTLDPTGTPNSTGSMIATPTGQSSARLASLANPQQVLTTRETVDSLPPDLKGRCRELYATKVRGRQTEVTVCEVLWKSDPDKTRVNTFGTDTSPRASWKYILKLTYQGDTFTFDEGATARLGRDASNEVVVATENASRLHARIFNKDGHFVIADQSTNGTFLMVDGTTQEVRLRRSEAVLGERGWIGVGKSAASHGDHVLRYRLERSS